MSSLTVMCVLGGLAQGRAAACRNMTQKPSPAAMLNPDKSITSPDIKSPDLQRSRCTADLCLPPASLQTHPKRSSVSAKLPSVSDGTPGCNGPLGGCRASVLWVSTRPRVQPFFPSFSRNSLPPPCSFQVSLLFML